MLKPNTASSWGTTAKLFHWLIALLIFAQFGLGWWATLIKLSPLKINLFVWHKSIGMLILVLGLPLSGWLLNSAAGVPFRIFRTISLPSLTEPDKHLVEMAALVHLLLFVGLAALLVLHIGAALRHHFIKRNDVLRRMLPTWRNSA